MLKITNLTKTYATAKKPTLKGLNLELKDGEIFGFLGSNGAGKTTTIKCICGILPFEEGQILINGKDLSKNPKEAKMELAYISDNHAVFERLTGREYVNHIANLYRVPEDVREERAEKLIKQFNLEHAYDRQIKSYSHGMKQKISVVSALVHDPKLWVLDEPLLGLDPQSAFVLKQTMKEHAAKGNTVFFSSHILEVVEALCDRIGILRNGVIEHIFELDEIKKSGQTLEEIYVKYVTPSNTDNTDSVALVSNDKKSRKTTKKSRKNSKKLSKSSNIVHFPSDAVIDEPKSTKTRQKKAKLVIKSQKLTKSLKKLNKAVVNSAEDSTAEE